MSVYTQESPGQWNVWLKKPENKNLSILEAKRKFLKEQLLFEQQYASFVQAQQQFLAQSANQTEGGVKFNDVTGTNFVADPVFQSLTLNTQSIDVHFGMPVDVTGAPRITVTNNQAGGGSAATFVYNHVGFASGATNILRFQHNHPAFVNNDGGAAANVLTQDKDLFSSITTQPSTATAETYVGETMVYAAGTGGTGGTNVTATIVVGDLEEVTSVIITNNGGGVFSPGNTLTLAGSNLGGSGNFIITLTTGDLTGDVISLGSQLIDLNGGTITTAAGNTQTTDTIRRQGAAPNLAIVGNNTKTVVGS